MEMLTSKEVAKMLGIAESTIHTWCSRKTVPFPMYKFSRRCVRFNKADVLAYLEKVKQ